MTGGYLKDIQESSRESVMSENLKRSRRSFSAEFKQDAVDLVVKQGYSFKAADAYGGYDGIYLQSNGAIVEVACGAHARRYWHKAREQDAARHHHVLAVINRLHELERATKNADAASRQKLRTEHIAPLLADLKQWLDARDVLPKSLIGKAATYTRNQWAALNRYLEDGDLSFVAVL